MSAPATPAAAGAAASDKVELTANESWLLSNALKNHKTGIVTADVNWDAVLAEEGCPYTTVSSIRVTFNKLKKKLNLSEVKNSGAAAGTPTTPPKNTTPKGVTPGTPRKAKAAAGSASKPTGVKKPRAKRTSSINKDGLANAVKDEDDPFTTPKGEEKSTGHSAPYALSMPAIKQEAPATEDAEAEAATDENLDS